MEPLSGLFLFLIFTAGVTFSDVFGALREKMNESPEDASDVTWAHAVNSQDALEKALASPVDFLEADVLMGYLKGNNDDKLPIMAHPPNKTSDVSLNAFLDTVVQSGVGKGLKLDFKSLEVLEPSMKILEAYSSKLNSSVWLNADVLPGPIKSRINPVPVDKFLALCNQYFPNATLSVGWTTLFLSTSAEESWHYEWQQVRQMADVIRCREYKNKPPKFTFPVRGIFASRSITQLQWLLSVVPQSSLTVWSAKFDPLSVEDLLRIRASFPKHLVYYDVPEPTSNVFNATKDSVDINKNLMVHNGNWMTITSGNGDDCSSLTYTKNNILFFGKNLTTIALQKNLYSLQEEPNLNVTGRIIFLGNDDPQSNSDDGSHELKIVAVAVSLFTKNISDTSLYEIDLTTSDSDIILSAVNSSAIYTFEHSYSKDEKSCHVFKLDTAADKSFEAWTVSCDDMLDGKSLEELIENGVSVISSRKRLVLPNEPFMFGFASTGKKYVVIQDLKIIGQKKDLTSSSVSLVTAPFILLTIVISCILSLFIVI